MSDKRPADTLRARLLRLTAPAPRPKRQKLQERPREVTVAGVRVVVTDTEADMATDRRDYDRALAFIAANGHMSLPGPEEMFPRADGGTDERFMGVPCIVPEGAERIGQVHLLTPISEDPHSLAITPPD